jgi:hypothetical protein
MKTNLFVLMGISLIFSACGKETLSQNNVEADGTCSASYQKSIQTLTRDHDAVQSRKANAGSAEYDQFSRQFAADCNTHLKKFPAAKTCKTPLITA